MSAPSRLRPADALAVAAGAITVGSMIATPLLPRGGRGRRRLTTAVVAGLAGTTAAHLTRRWGGGRTVATAAVVTGATAAIERVGTRTGLPFGRYSYTGALRPEIAGVPVIVPLAWFAMAPAARETAHGALGARSSAPTRTVLGAAALTAWDLFLDPQMVGEGYWRWTRAGRYRGIPVSNYLGWLCTGIVLMAALERLVPVTDRGADESGVATGSDGALTVQYAYMAVMETIGFARFFGDRLVAAVGGAAMLPIAAASLVRGRRG